MNSLRSTAAASLLAATSLLTGSPAQAAPKDAASLAEALGLPLNQQRMHFNRATQTGLLEKCVLVSDTKITCNLDVLANEALLDYRQRVDYEIGNDGALSISTSAYDIGTDWSSQDEFKKYKNIRDNAVISEWSANSPLAHIAQDGSGRVVQNDSKQISLIDGGEGADVRSSIPVNEFRGFDIHTVFDGATDRLQSFVVPRVTFDNVSIYAEPDTEASRDMNYAAPSRDGDIMNAYIARAQAAGGMAYRFPE